MIAFGLSPNERASALDRFLELATRLGFVDGASFEQMLDSIAEEDLARVNIAELSSRILSLRSLWHADHPIIAGWYPIGCMIAGTVCCVLALYLK